MPLRGTSPCALTAATPIAPAFHELFFVPFFGHRILNRSAVSGRISVSTGPRHRRVASRLPVTTYSRLDDLIQLTFAQSAGLFISENVAEARILGFEIEGEYR